MKNIIFCNNFTLIFLNLFLKKKNTYFPATLYEQNMNK